MSPASPRAAIDIGTNSVRLLIRDAAGTELLRRMTITRLGAGVDATSNLDPRAMDRTLAVVGDYAEACRVHGVSQLRATATSAARDAANRDAFFRPAAELLGQELELLSGHEEARLSFRGATFGLDPSLAPFMVFDIGGGSTELSFGVETPEASTSLNIGGVRITERFLKSDPPRPDEITAARAFAVQLLSEAAATLSPSRARTWLGLAGTVTSFAAIALELETYDPGRTHGFILERDRAFDIFERLRSVTVRRRRELLIQPQRAEVIVGGGIVLLAIFEVFGLARIRVSESDILDGLAASLFD